MQALLLRFLENGEMQRVGADERTRRGRCPHRRRDESQPRRARGGRRVPRGSAVPSARDSHPRAAAPRAPRGHPAPCRAFRVARVRSPVQFTTKALELLQRYRWPGNVRELQNIVEQAVWQSDATEIGAGAPARTCVRATEAADADARAPPAGCRRTVRCAREWRLFVLGAHPPAVSRSRHHASRHQGTGAQRTADDARKLSWYCCRSSG